ncbi:MAG: sirohydrochlorin chelatase [Bacillus sp. (in: firmicutes)]
MRAILYVGHGTRAKKGAEEAKRFLQSVMDKVNEPIQEISFLELTEPSIEAGFRRCVEQGATSIDVVPIFLLTAGHMKHDIPDALQVLQEQYPHVNVKLLEAFGVQEQILDAIAELVQDTAGVLSPHDSVLLVGRGSSDVTIQNDFANIASGLRARIGVERVDVCYLAAAEPSFADGLEKICREANASIVVVPYLLFGGLLLSEVQSAVRKKQQAGQLIVAANALSRHAAIQDLVVARALWEGSVDVHAASNH